MPVVKFQPLACRVQDFLNALSATLDTPFVIVGPDGKAITDTLIDVPMIGLTTKKGYPNQPFGFARMEKIYSQTTPSEYDAEAFLVLELRPEDLPKELSQLGGTIWLLELVSDNMTAYYENIATALNDEFKELGVIIVIKPQQMKDEDTKHLPSRPVNAQSPTITFCPIIPK